MSTIIRIIETVLSIPKSLLFCLATMDLKDALHIPILLRFNTKIRTLKGKVLIDGPQNIHFGFIKFGFPIIGTHDERYSRSVIELEGVIKFCGRARLGSGSKIWVGQSGILEIGDNFCNTAALHLCCSTRVLFGKNVLISWETNIMDTDFHNLIDTSANLVRECQKDVIIGDNCWIGAHSIILKGTSLSAGTVVGAGAVVAGTFTKRNCILCGNPARITREDCTLYRGQN